MGCSFQATYANLLSVITQTFPAFVWGFLNQISLSFLLRGQQQEKHRTFMKESSPQPLRRLTQQQQMGWVQPRQLWRRHTQMGAAASVSSTATAENMKGEAFSKPWEFARFRQFLSGTVQCSSFNRTGPDRLFSLCAKHQSSLPLKISPSPLSFLLRSWEKTLMLKFYKQNKAFHPQKLVRKVQPPQSKSGKVKRKRKQRPAKENVKKCELWIVLLMSPVQKYPTVISVDLPSVLLHLFLVLFLIPQILG